MSKIYIGIDPDLRTLSAAIVTDDRTLRTVMIRRNKEGKGDAAVANAARMSCRLIEDVIAFFVGADGLEEYRDSEIILVVESQNMEYTGKTNKARKSGMVQLSQTAGCLMGAFSNMSHHIHLVQPLQWKGNVPKGIHHQRIYAELEIPCVMAGGKSSYAYPANFEKYTYWSTDKINPGDFKDITDSIGLALFGVKKGL